MNCTKGFNKQRSYCTYKKISTRKALKIVPKQRFGSFIYFNQRNRLVDELHLFYNVKISKMNSDFKMLQIVGDVIVHSTYVLYDIVPLGFLILLVYIFIDVFLDYFRKVIKSNKKRVILYTFIFYLISLIEIKFGGFTLPQNPADIRKTFISTNDWFGIFDLMNFKISMWNYSAMVYNVILFIPLGIYLFLLFNLISNKKAISMVILSCLVIDVARLLLGWSGFTISNFGNTDIIYLLFNVLGGVLGTFLVKYAVNYIHLYKLNNQTKIVE